MKEQVCRGRLSYFSFILLDLFCLVAANRIATRIYQIYGHFSYRDSYYAVVVAYMAGIDILVTLAFNTLDRVLRRRKKKEILECFKHVAISIVLLALFLFSTKQGAAYSRVTIYLAYGFYFLFLVFFRILWKEILKRIQRRNENPSSMLITTAGYANEGINVVEKSGITIKGLFLTDKANEGAIKGIPVMTDSRKVTVFLCWEWIDRVYICGPDSIDVPESLIVACKQMGIPVITAPAGKSLEYEVVKIRTAWQKEGKSTGLSFFESEHDIPFRISSLCTIFESEQNNQNGFHAHKQSWHLFFCPYGEIDIVVDTGRERKRIALSEPSIGLILHPSVWREIIWEKAGSVLCVAASGHYDAGKLRNDYREYLLFLQEKEWSATVESAEIMGEVIQ